MKIGGKAISFSSYSLYLDIIFFSLLNHYLLVVANVNTLGVVCSITNLGEVEGVTGILSRDRKL